MWLQQVVNAFSPRQWLVMAVLSGILASGSGLFLAVSAGLQLSEPWADWYDHCELFIRDTFRLTFRRTSKTKTRSLDDRNFRAPVGILVPDKPLVWLDANVAARPSSSLAETSVKPPIGTTRLSQVKTPSKMLDPDWQPDFKVQ